MGILLAEAGDHDQAIEYLRRALVLAPVNPDIRMNLANVLALNFAIDEAVALYDEALSKNADCPDLLCNLGNALSRAERRQEAADCYRNAIAAHPDHADAHASFANNLLADGNFREGWSHYLYRLIWNGWRNCGILCRILARHPGPIRRGKQYDQLPTRSGAKTLGRSSSDTGGISMDERWKRLAVVSEERDISAKTRW